MLRQRRINEQTVQSGEVSNEQVKNASHCEVVLCRWFLLTSLFLYVMVPVLPLVFPQIIEQIIFMNLHCERNAAETLKAPATEYGLHGTGTFYIDCDDAKLGVWHVLPKSIAHMYEDDELPDVMKMEHTLQDAQNIIVYYHGNTMSRATGENQHRAEFYKALQNSDFHTIAFDYRGFGDSTGWPSEAGLLRDSRCILKWLTKKAPSGAKIIPWAHSLGTAILSKSILQIQDDCKQGSADCVSIDGVIMEGGFTNISQGARDSAPAQLFNILYPEFIFEEILDRSLSALQIEMATEINMAKIKCPILLLHAEDDDIIPIHHSQYLWNIIKHSEFKPRCKSIRFKASYGYSHCYVYKHDKMYEMVKEFFNNDDDHGLEIVI